MILSKQVRKLISLKKACRFFMNLTIVFFISTSVALTFMAENSYASTLFVSSINSPSYQIAWGERAKATGKYIEGKTQEVIGNMTGDSKDQFMGKAKQVESQARNAIEDIKGN